MEEMIRNKIRTYGAIFLVLTVFLVVILLFLQFKEKSITALKLKVIHSEITQATVTSVRENGMPSEWGLTTDTDITEPIDTKFFAYFENDGLCNYTNKCTYNKNYKSIKSKKTNINIKDLPTIKIKNGATISFKTESSCLKLNENCAKIFVDLNGNDGPNALGKDLFIFELQNSTSNLIRAYGENLSIKEIREDEINGCNKKSKQSMYCAAFIKKSNWHIKNNYPW